MVLERIEPSFGRGERIRLDTSRSSFRFGRAEENDVRLYTASASREHAEICSTQSGEWLVAPLSGKSITVDGDPTTRPVRLELGMNLELGEDHLRCVAEGLSVADAVRRTSPGGTEPERSEEVGPGLWGRARQRPLLTAVSLVLIGLLFAWSFQ
jgi:pSer/pThr/pTyr-binding forkhead associated (FHA) protein